MNVVFDLPWPPSVNTYWRHTIVNRRPRVLISKKGRDYRKAVLRSIGIRHQKIHGRVSVWIGAQAPDRRARDLDNLPKAILDALTHAGVWGDDEQIDQLTIVRQPVVEGGAIRVVISDEIEPERTTA
ncbi:RusA family crossover junction endodeoxyribonuclease [Marinobacter sp.]|uniref:RusA family crossover junction endodeoxyribonuclease n=1 Tax=Marinobacter sp. TaxID=50741 RepID=UPI0035C6A2FE